MADELIRKPRVHTDPTHVRDSRAILGLFGAVIVVVVILLLLFRGFGAAPQIGAETNGGKKIVPVEGLTANPGYVSAWVSADGNISQVLRVAGLENSNITDLGGGRYVISVPVGTEDTVVRMLAEIDGVYDAGRVYGESQ